MGVRGRGGPYCYVGSPASPPGLFRRNGRRRMVVPPFQKIVCVWEGLAGNGMALDGARASKVAEADFFSSRLAEHGFGRIAAVLAAY